MVIKRPAEAESRHRKLRRFLREYRELRGLTQIDVAEAIGMSRLSYHRIESGAQRLKMVDFKAICAVLSTDADRLLREAGYTALVEE